MWTRRPDAFPFRPAPFPTYPEDSGRLGLERGLRLSRLLCAALLLLAPVFAGPSSELSFPVSYARVELAERAPVLLELDLPAADYHVSPASLGYFADSGEFVYSAEVARGLIYGQSGRKVLVVEIAAPQSAKLYLDRQLDTIRERVAEVNRCRNRLRLERGREIGDQTAAGGYLAALAGQLGPDLDGPLPDDATGSPLPVQGPDAPDPASALADYGHHRARLKQLYYKAQSARLQLMLSKYDLQVALARLPQPQLETPLVAGDERLVRSTMLNEIGRLEQAWSARSKQLKNRIVADRDRLEAADRAARRGARATAEPTPGPAATPDGHQTTESTAGAAPVDAVGYALPATGGGMAWISAGGAGGGGDSGGAGRVGKPGAERQADVNLLEARLTIAATELNELRERLAELAGARQHVQDGRVPAWTDLPRLAPRLKQLQLKGLEALDAFALVEAEAREPQTAAPLLLSLDQEFERPQAGDKDGPAAKWRLGPDEVAYGLLAVDRCRLGDVDRGGADPAHDRQAAGQLLAAIQTMLTFPADYDTAAYNLGYLEFIRWYATLDQPAEVAEAQPPPEEPAAEPEAQAAAEDDEVPKQADVDDLFN